MADKPTQKNREIAIHTPLGEDVLLLRSFSGTEQLGRPFRYQVVLASENPAIKAADIVGQNVTIRLNLPKDEIRYFNGYISSFTQEPGTTRLASYRATVVPWLWFLTRTADCRIFQKMMVPDIIEQVFGDHGFTDFDGSDLKENYRIWPYCVQYRETDFNFVSRLMEQEGIYYFFKHENGKHSLMLIDTAGEHEPYPNYEQIKHHPATAGTSEEEYISRWVVQTRIQPGSYALNDFNFENTKNDLQVRAKVERKHAGAKFEIYDYPGEYDEFDDGELYARKRIEELQAQYEVVTATSDARGICTGYTFTLTDHPLKDQNKKYLITSANYNMDTADFYSGGERGGECAYSCSFTAIDATQPFRAPRITPKPSIPGPQTAMVVGPSGEEIYPDKYGRVKVQFHWDRRSKADENSSCWIRVAQIWAGKKWGAMYIPRIGQEVIVEFLEGDPDQPIITGRVYNAEAMPPYEPNSNPTMSTLKSNSSKGGGGFNEIRFEDKKGDEQIFIHGEKDEDVRIKNDSKEWIGNERHLIVKSDQLELVEGDKHLTVMGDQNEKIDGTISIEAGSDIQEKAGSNYGFEAGSNIHIKGGMNVVIEAGMQLSIKAGSSFVDLGPAGVSISGTLVNINSGGAAGSGAGCTPDAPKEPKEAATADPGEVSEPPKPPKPPTPVTFSPQATVMKEAAKDGTPFCEECEKAKQQQAG
jgi:type VI secretion system secreted protein VgrG